MRPRIVGGGGGGQPASNNYFSGRTVMAQVTRVATLALPLGPAVQSSDGGTLENDAPRPIEVRVGFPNGVIPPNVGVYYQVNYYVGGAQFSTPLALIQGGAFNLANRKIVFGNKVQVILWGVSNTQGGTFSSDVPVSVAMYPSVELGSDRYAWQWAKPLHNSLGNIVDAQYGLKFAGGGVLSSFKFDLETAATGNEPLWPMYFDLADVANLVSGTTLPIPGAVGAPLTAVNTSTFFGDNNPGSIQWSNGLVFALSKTSTLYTVPDGAPLGNVQTQVGL